MLVFFLLSIACIVFGVLCLSGVKKQWITAHLCVWASVYGALVILLYLFSAWAIVKEKAALIKFFLTVYVLVAFGLMLWWIFQRTGFFEVFGNAEQLQLYLEKAGLWMPVLYTALQFLQVVLLPIPSIVSTIAGIALFGAFWTTVYSFIGITLGSILAFYIGRRWGNRAAVWLVGEEKLKKWQKKLKGKDNIVLTTMFILPAFPDDILCFLAGISSMSWRYFLIMMGISRLVAIASTCYSVDFIPFNTWWGVLLWIGIILTLVTAVMLTYKNIDKLQTWIKSMKKQRKDKKQSD
ncbi:MAG: TVP38/TMEM64 family protein [Clostridia bacterium]|nr:TVP38/TMEM64 family protein [Clostridia bacterium]